MGLDEVLLSRGCVVVGLDEIFNSEKVLLLLWERDVPAG